MKIGLTGDLEGEVEAAVVCLRSLGERGDIDVACQLGDLRFGYGPDHEGYLDTIESLGARCDPGNVRVLDPDTLTDTTGDPTP